MLGQTSGVISPYQNKEKFFYLYIPANIFRSTAPKRVELNPLDYYR